MQSIPSNRKRPYASIIAIFVICFILALWILPYAFPWNEWDSKIQELDINTGRLKYSRYLCLLKISERIEETDISRILPKELLERAIPEWHRANRDAPWITADYVFGEAPSQINELSIWWEVEQVPETVRRKTAIHLLALWKYGGASAYLRSLHFGNDFVKKQNTLATIEALEMPLIEKDGSNVVATVFYPDGTPLRRKRGYYEPAGKLARNGVSEVWCATGEISLYDNYRDDKLDGKRFEWSNGGKLSSIEGFRVGELTEYESKNLERHPDYKLAQAIAATNFAHSIFTRTNSH
jgi:hypothetical protein